MRRCDCKMFVSFSLASNKMNYEFKQSGLFDKEFESLTEK